MNPTEQMEGFIEWLHKTQNIHLPLSNETFVNILEETFTK